MDEERYMRRAIELARLGEGWTNPNPMVGAVIVKDGRIIGEGYHRKCGELHAERNALSSLTESAVGAAVYVTLEPCCHYGKTPPCTEAIIESGISKVVIGSQDPNPLVSGRGAGILREAGIEVVQGFLKEECDALNPIFFHYITSKTPYVIMKYAMTMDGKIATKTGASKWITGAEALEKVHALRHKCMGIMAGICTVLADDPMLNCRSREISKRRDPVRIICDSHLRIPLESKLVKTAGDQETFVIFAEKAALSGAILDKMKALHEAGITCVNLPDESGKVDMRALTEFLGEKGIDSVLLEGGGTLNESALRAGIVQEIYAFVAPKIFGGTAPGPVMGEGVELPKDAMTFELAEMQKMGQDAFLRFVKRSGVEAEL